MPLPVFFPDALLSLEEIEDSIMSSIEGYINQVEIEAQILMIKIDNLGV